VSTEVGWHLRFVQASRVDVWANPGQAPIFAELAATFGQWRLESEEIDGVLRFSFLR